MTAEQISPESTVWRIDDIVSSDIDGEVVMLDIESGSYYGLNDSAGRIWELIETPVTVSRILSELSAEYDVPTDTCLGETTVFLTMLLEKGLIRVRPGQA